MSEASEASSLRTETNTLGERELEGRRGLMTSEMHLILAGSDLILPSSYGFGLCSVDCKKPICSTALV